MAYVIDASVAVKWFVTEQDTNTALALLQSESALFTPAFMFEEASNILRKKCKAGIIGVDDARERLTQLPRYFQPMTKQPDFVMAFDLSVQIDHPVYDCIYLRAALDNGLPLVTADKTLARKAKLIANLVVHELSTWSVPKKS